MTKKLLTLTLSVMMMLTSLNLNMIVKADDELVEDPVGDVIIEIVDNQDDEIEIVENNDPVVDVVESTITEEPVEDTPVVDEPVLDTPIEEDTPVVDEPVQTAVEDTPVTTPVTPVEEKNEEPVKNNSEDTVLSNEDVTVVGYLPAGTELDAQAVLLGIKPQLKNIRKKLSPVKGTDSDGEVTVEDNDIVANIENVIAAYDIKLVKDGEAIQPENRVKVTIQNIPVDRYKTVKVLHILDSVEAINNAINNGKAIKVTDPDYLEAFADEVKVAKEATGEENVIYIEYIDEDNNLVVEGTTISFDADSFSVYAVIGEDEYKVLTLEFYQNASSTTPIDIIYVKDGDTESELETIVYDPGCTISTNQIFKGWFIETPDYTTDNVESAMSVEDIRTWVLSEAFSTYNDGDVVKFYAGVYNIYVVSYYGDDNVAVASDTVLTVPNQSSVLYQISQDYTPVDDEHDFEGWKVIDGASNIENHQSGQLYQYEDEITISGNISFGIEAPLGHWLVFNENGKGGKYNAPIFIKANEVTRKPCEDEEMTRLGYRFVAWYNGHIEKDENNKDIVVLDDEFVFGNAIEETTNIYAKWEAVTEATYTIIIWKQSVSGGDNWDFEESLQLTGTVGTNINTVSQTGTGNNAKAIVNGVTKSWEGFHLKEYDQNVEIKPEGTSVLNVYYDRNEYTFRFQIDGQYYEETTSNSGTQYGLVDGQYIQLTRNGNTWYYTQYTYTPGYNNDHDNSPEKYGLVNGEYARVYWHNSWLYTGWSTSNNWYNGDWYNGDVYIRTSNTVTYTGTRYSSQNGWHTIKEIKALYQQNISSYFPIVGDNGVTYNQGERWMPQNDPEWHEVMVIVDTMPSRDVTFRLNTSTAGTKTMNYYIEALPGETVNTTYNGKNFTLHNSVQANYNGVTVEDYIDLQGCEKYAVNPSYTYNNGNYTYYVGSSNSTTAATTVNFYYTRKTFDLIYLDGVYVDGNGNTIDENRKVDAWKEVDDVLYEANLSSYNKNGNNYFDPSTHSDAKTDKYVFEGWYIDDACTKPYTFSKMPEGGITVYAKWRIIQYRVFLHPNAGTDPSLDWGSATQRMNFRVDVGGKVSLPTGLREEYEFVGWYKNYTGDSDGSGTYTNQFNQVRRLDESIVTANYDKTTDFTDTMDKWGNGATTNGDLDRFWITKKFDLYAKWRKKIIGADGIYVVYDLNGGSAGGNNYNDTNRYLDTAEVTAKPACTPPNDKVFSHWVVETYNKTTGEYEYDENSVIVLPGNDFQVLLDNAKQEQNADHTEENPSYTYTVQLKAIYVDNEDVVPTHIDWYANNGSGEKVSINGIKINEPVDIKPADTFSYPGHKFLGWARVNSEEASGADMPSLDEDDLFLIWNEEDNKFYTQNGTAVTRVAADERQPYHDLYAVWELLPFDLTVKKVVVGAPNGDNTSYPFEIVIGNNSSESFSLANNGEKLFKDIDFETSILLTEHSGDRYEVQSIDITALLDGVNKIVTPTISNDTYSFTIQGDTTVVLTNIYKYQVTYHKNDGSDTTKVDPNYHVYNSNVNTLRNEFEREGYTFIGWATTPEGNAEYIGDNNDGAVPEAFVITQDTHLYAIWEPIPYTLTIKKVVEGSDADKANEHQFTPKFDNEAQDVFTLIDNAVKEYKDEDKVPYDTVVNLTETLGERFEIKTVTVNGETTAVNNGSIEFTIKGDTEVVVTNIYKYNVTYDKNAEDATGETTDPANPHLYNSKVDTVANGFSRTGYTFVEWNTKEDGTGTSYQAQQTEAFTITEDTTLYAIWEPIPYTLTIKKVVEGSDADKANEHQFTPKFDNEAQDVFTLIDNAVKEYKDEDKVPYDTVVNLTETLGERFEIKTVTVNGETVEVNNGSIEFTIKGDTEVVVTNIYKYNVTYDKNAEDATGDTIDTANPHLYNSKVDTVANGYSRTGYTFVEWNTKADGSGTSYQASQTEAFTITEDITLYAIWKTTITYVVAGPKGIASSNAVPAGGELGGTITVSDTVDVYYFSGEFLDGDDTTAVTEIANAKRFKFVGWYVEDTNGSYELNGVKFQKISSDTSYTPAWAPGTYYAIYEYNLAELKITKRVNELMDQYLPGDEQSFIFKIDGLASDTETKNVHMTVIIDCPTVNTDYSVILADLPVGQYTVTELTNWSWRYTLETNKVTVIDEEGTSTAANNGVTIELPTTVEVKCENKLNNRQWLSGTHYKDFLIPSGN